MSLLRIISSSIPAFTRRGKCQCGQPVGPNPDEIRQHIAHHIVVALDNNGYEILRKQSRPDIEVLPEEEATELYARVIKAVHPAISEDELEEQVTKIIDHQKHRGIR